MLLRCGGNVIEIGRRQIAMVAAAAVILMMFSIYSLSLLQGMRHADEDWVQPTPIDHVLKRAGREHHRPRGAELRGQPDEPDLPKKNDKTLPDTLKTTGGLTSSILTDFVLEI